MNAKYCKKSFTLVLLPEITVNLYWPIHNLNRALEWGKSTLGLWYCCLVPSILLGTHYTYYYHFVHFVVVTLTQDFAYAGFGFTRPGNTCGGLGELDYTGTGSVAGLEAVGGAGSSFHSVEGCW